VLIKWTSVSPWYRVLKPGGVFIVSFSNRMFYDKAITAWRAGALTMLITSIPVPSII
jgi:ubiquinone/menaquinone biosynthesis C-methylase UbiE